MCVDMCVHVRLGAGVGVYVCYIGASFPDHRPRAKRPRGQEVKGFMGVMGGLPTRTLTDPSHPWPPANWRAAPTGPNRAQFCPVSRPPCPRTAHPPPPTGELASRQPPAQLSPQLSPNSLPPAEANRPQGHGHGQCANESGSEPGSPTSPTSPGKPGLDSTRLELASTRARVTHYRRRPRSCLAQVRLLIDSPAPLGHESGPQRFPGPDSNPRGRPTSRLYQGHRTLPTGESRPQVQDAAPPPGGHARLPTGQLPWEGHRPSCPSL